MVTSSCCISSCSNAGGAYTTNKERLTFEKEIEERIYCIAGHVSDEQSVQSFLSQVRDPCATYNKELEDYLGLMEELPQNA